MKVMLEGFTADAVSASGSVSPGYAAHVSIAAMHINLVEERIAGGLSCEMIQQAQAQHLEALIQVAR